MKIDSSLSKSKLGKNEKGVTFVEAAIVLPIFLFTILCALLIFGQCFRIFSTYYAMFESMRLSSVQAAGENATDKLNDALDARLKAYQTNITREKVIARVPDGTANGTCMQLKASNPPKYWPTSTCGAFDASRPLFRVLPSSYYTLESSIQFMDLQLPWMTLPQSRVRSIIKTQEW